MGIAWVYVMRKIIGSAQPSSTNCVPASSQCSSYFRSPGKPEVFGKTPQNVAVDDQVSILHEQLVTLAHHRRDRETLG